MIRHVFKKLEGSGDELNPEALKVCLQKLLTNLVDDVVLYNAKQEVGISGDLRSVPLVFNENSFLVISVAFISDLFLIGSSYISAASLPKIVAFAI